MVWSAVIGTIAVPVLLITYFNSSLIAAMPIFRDNTSFRTTVERLQPPSGGIVTGRGDRAEQVARLRSFTARPEMAAGAATRVNFVIVAFTEKPEPNARSGSRHIIDRDGYRRMTLDLAGLQRQALVIIADEPIRWTVTGANSAWGLIGFEGLAPFDIANGRPGMLAGYRIAAFGARDTASAGSPLQDDQRRRYNLCRSLQAWTAHFGTSVSHTAFALVTDPTNIGSSNGAITTDGQAGVSWTGPAIESYCRRGPPPSSTTRRR
jgi:hypothetical protein